MAIEYVGNAVVLHDIFEEARMVFPKTFSAKQAIKKLTLIDPSDATQLKIVWRNGDFDIYDSLSKSIHHVSKERQKEIKDYDLDIRVFSHIFSINLNRVMKREGVDQRTLARKTGFSERMVSLYCTGLSLPGSYQVYRICQALSCSVDEILNLKKYYYGITI